MAPAPVTGMRAAVVGLGTMGAGIARLLARLGVATTVFDPSADAVARAGLDAGVTVSPTLAACAADADIVFEAVFESLDAKRPVLAAISAATDGVIASNTSTFTPSVLARMVEDPGRLLVAHFFHPAEVVPLVEVVPSPGTRREAVDAVRALLERLGKAPVLLHAEAPGFVANRLQAAVLREALALVDAGVVDAEGIDRVVTTGLGPRWAVAGPLGVADLGGLDIFETVCAELFPTLSAAVVPSRQLSDRVARGDLGAKSGQGFGSYSAARRTALLEEMRRRFADAPRDDG
jgi:3-hydroxybutyryl-CoA dehydrogenase